MPIQQKLCAHVPNPLSIVTKVLFVRTKKNEINVNVYLTDSSKYPAIVYAPSDVDIMQHFAIVKSGNIYKLYYAGVDTSTQMDNYGLHYILDGDLLLNGDSKLINKILIYNRALTQEEITQNHNSIVMEVGEY